MLQEERFFNIIEYLKANGTAKLSQLAALNGVSVDTVRRDLETLDGYGLLERVRGGAVRKEENMDRQISGMRTMVNGKEKASLAEGVTQVVSEGETIILGSGTTAAEIAGALARSYKRLTVITNDMGVVQALSPKEHFTVIVAGGILDPEENATFGDQCEEEIRQYNADLCIISGSSLSPEKGVTDFRLDQAEVFKAMLASSARRVVAADHEKFLKSPACMNVCPVEDIHVILTDKGLPPETGKLYEARGIRVIAS